jgi:hypothetical protein
MTKLPPLPKVHDLGGDEFERLLHQLLLAYADREKFEYAPHSKAGAQEEGIDGLAPQGGVPGLKGPVAFQFKWLTGNLSKGENARQTTGSVRDAASSEIKFHHYVVVTPENIAPAQKKWLLSLSPGKCFKIHHWGQAKLTSLFRLSPDLLAQYYPQSARAAAVDKVTPKTLSAYLDWLVRDCAPLRLRAIDQGAARSGRKPLGLTSVYVDLDLTLRIPRKQSLAAWLSRPPGDPALLRGRGEEAQREDRRVAVLEALAHDPRLVLLGAPGSGKSTLAAYLALSLAEAAQGRKKSLTRLGAWWKTDPLLPVRVVLREFAASLPPKIAKGRAEHLWEFLGAECKRLGLAAPTADALRQTAADAGALFLLDGLVSTKANSSPSSGPCWATPARPNSPSNTSKSAPASCLARGRATTSANTPSPTARFRNTSPPVGWRTSQTSVCAAWTSARQPGDSILGLYHGAAPALAQAPERVPLSTQAAQVGRSVRRRRNPPRHGHRERAQLGGTRAPRQHGRTAQGDPRSGPVETESSATTGNWSCRCPAAWLTVLARATRDSSPP